MILERIRVPFLQYKCMLRAWPLDIVTILWTNEKWFLVVSTKDLLIIPLYRSPGFTLDENSLNQQI